MHKVGNKIEPHLGISLHLHVLYTVPLTPMVLRNTNLTSDHRTGHIHSGDNEHYQFPRCDAVHPAEIHDMVYDMIWYLLTGIG